MTAATYSKVCTLIVGFGISTVNASMNDWIPQSHPKSFHIYSGN